MSPVNISSAIYIIGGYALQSSYRIVYERKCSIACVIYGRANEVSHYLTHIARARNRESKRGVRIMINELIMTWWTLARAHARNNVAPVISAINAGADRC